MAIEGAEVEAGFLPADDDGATVPGLMRGLHGLIDDPRWRMICALSADLAEHPSADDDRAARVMTDAYLQGMTEVGSVATLVHTRPVSRKEDSETVNHLATRSNVAMTDPRHNAITALILGVGKTESRTM